MVQPKPASAIIKERIAVCTSTAGKTDIPSNPTLRQTIEAPELKAGIPFAYDEIISIHSQEPTLEDVFIQYTGRGLS
jgi:hypothetical protein